MLAIEWLTPAAQLIGYCGAAAIVLAYFLNQRGRLGLRRLALSSHQPGRIRVAAALAVVSAQSPVGRHRAVLARDQPLWAAAQSPPGRRRSARSLTIASSATSTSAASAWVTRRPAANDTWSSRAAASRSAAGSRGSRASSQFCTVSGTASCRAASKLANSVRNISSPGACNSTAVTARNRLARSGRRVTQRCRRQRRGEQHWQPRLGGRVQQVQQRLWLGAVGIVQGQAAGGR